MMNSILIVWTRNNTDKLGVTIKLDGQRRTDPIYRLKVKYQKLCRLVISQIFKTIINGEDTLFSLSYNFSYISGTQPEIYGAGHNTWQKRFHIIMVHFWNSELDQMVARY